MAGFGKDSGPSHTPKALNPFATFSSPSPPNPNPNPSLAPNFSTTPNPQRSSTVAFDTTTHDTAKRTRSPPLPPRDEDDVLGLYNPPNSNARRPSVSRSWDNNPMQSVNASYTMIPQRLSPVSASTSTHVAEANIPTKPHNFNAAKRTRSPPLSSREDDILGLYNPPIYNAGRSALPPGWDGWPKKPVNVSYMNPQRLSPVAVTTTTHAVEANILTKPNNFSAAKRTRSPPLPAREDDILGLYNPPNSNARRLTMSPSLDNQPKKPVDLSSTMNNQMLSPNSTVHSVTVNFPTKLINPDVAKRARTPPLPLHEDDSLGVYNQTTGISRRHDISPQKVGSQRKSPNSTSDPSALHIVESSLGNPSLLRASYPNPNPKRTRSPSLQSADSSSTSSIIQLESEREIQAKAKRLARFNVELSQPLQTSQDLTMHTISTNKHDRVEEAHDTAGMVSDYEGMGLPTVVVGLCPDMCPEQEREERERKGDLDKFERLDGERNQTTEFLAVKKYNRTAEREADLIRPLPVLRKTVDYLLNLLDQPYDESFLGIYNFLWDRMRAIRMDLRMQHIFNQEAILMLEQMIRLHVVAMHELCEYKKGEGFVEGFDAHLNIEQMNKTSVELFQMYEDHRKRGISIKTEKEFRGYYALLKLDKHPGYKVEPSELSLDLAKMTPQMRCTQEILFARDVARACRVGNYIAFFRLARKATYLQACLMHAHFAKLRTQALASLHSGLQNNQGIPISHVVKWLCMEGEDIESLLEYHGFSLRKYEEVYMVKEGPFLNIDADYPTKCSSLVHLKRSRSIMDDVKSGLSISELTEERKTESDAIEMITDQSNQSNVVDEEMFHFKVNSTPRVISQPQRSFEGPLPVVLNREDDHELTDVSLAVWNVESDREMIEPASPIGAPSLTEDDSVNDQEDHAESGQLAGYLGPSSPTREGLVQAALPVSSNLNFVPLNPVLQKEADKNIENEAVLLVQKAEVLRERLKLILRKWKERSSALRAIREQKDFLANAALSSLSLGPPIRQQTGQSCIAEELDIDSIARKRYKKLGKSWARLNVSDLVAPILSRRNPDAKCISWKLLFLVQANTTGSQMYNLASKWLLLKLMGPVEEEANDRVLISSPSLSIWKKWIGSPINQSQSCCLSIIREMKLFNTNQPVSEDDLVAGSSCLLFLASGSISWDIQRVQLHRILMSIPAGSSLPLLILSVDPYDPLVDIIQSLGLREVDKTKISSSSVIFIHGNSFFDDDQLKEGLQWLANHSPPQPVLYPVITRDLVSSYLRRSMAPLENLRTSEVGPHHCILAFNEALSLSTEEIICAASRNPNNWPSPEISLIEKSDVYLPSVGWSSTERIKLIISALNSCRLPSFPNDMSQLNHGSFTMTDLENQKEAIEESLVSYLTHSTRLLNYDLALREASVMVQKGAGLELRDASYHIVPRWIVIFRRIFNWQLMRLSRTTSDEAYIFARKEVNETENLESGFNFETEISFDELVEISCNLLLREQPVTAINPKSSPPASSEEGDKNLASNNIACDVSPTVDTHELRESPVSSEKLDVLLDRCKRVQDSIDKMLFLYF